MAGKIPEDLRVQAERVVLCGAYLPRELARDEPPLEELGRLVETAGGIAAGRLVQNIRQPYPRHYIGPGKVKELQELALRAGAKVIAFDNDLNPAQGRNLEKDLGLRVIDRTELILDIFTSRAATRPAKMQVALALHLYRLPRLRRMWTHLERQTGGIGVRAGPGERQLEVDRRVIQKKIHSYRQQLTALAGRKQRQVQTRSKSHFLVAMVGYTNTGKTTLLNALTGAGAFADDKLFATLDTRTRAWKLPEAKVVLLSDTVGFIRRLPHQLIASFHSTLEEVRQADLLLHVVDVSSPTFREQMRAVENTLEALGLCQRETIVVFNKVDLCGDAVELRALGEEYPGAVAVSARRGDNLAALASAVAAAAARRSTTVRLSLDLADGKTLAFLDRWASQQQRQVVDGRMIVEARLDPPHLASLRHMSPSLEVLEG